jgi:hypothetical protein
MQHGKGHLTLHNKDKEQRRQRVTLPKPSRMAYPLHWPTIEKNVRARCGKEDRNPIDPMMGAS